MQNVLILPILTIFLISGCASTKQLEIFTKEIERVPLNLELPPIETLEQVNLIVITSDNQEEVFAKMKEANIDKDLFNKLQMEIKDKSEFKNEITSRMKNEVAIQEKELTKESMYETLLKTNNFKIPNATVNEQADLMRKDALMRIGHSEDNAGDDLFPIESFMEKAEKRVKLDLLFAELVNHFDIKVEKQNIDDFIDEESKRYKDPEQYKKWITGQPQQLEQFKMIVLEKQLVEKLENVLKSKKKVIKFSELANR